MSLTPAASNDEIHRRARALSRIGGDPVRDADRSSGSRALGVLHALALSQSTAPDALALLHELQVHQVELDMQAEEMREGYAELEAALLRQTRLYDHAPVALLTVDRAGLVRELNLQAARLLGGDRESLVEQPLGAHLSPASLARLLAWVAQAIAGMTDVHGELELSGSLQSRVRVTLTGDPAGQCVLIAAVAAGPRADDAALP